MEPHPLDPTYPKEREAVVVLQTSELAFHGGAAEITCPQPRTRFSSSSLLVHAQTHLDQLDTYDDNDLVPLLETMGILPLKIGHPEIPGKLF